MDLVLNEREENLNDIAEAIGALGDVDSDIAHALFVAEDLEQDPALLDKMKRCRAKLEKVYWEFTALVEDMRSKEGL